MFRFYLDQEYYSARFYLADGITAKRLWRKLCRDYMPRFTEDPIFRADRMYAIEVHDGELTAIPGASFMRYYASDVHM